MNDPWTILGVEPSANDDAIRAAYREHVKLHPPDTDAAGFARISEAYAQVKDPRARARERLFGPKPLAHIGELVEALRLSPRPPAGPALWLAALKEHA